MDVSDRPLRDRGMRVTPQRARIWQILAVSGEHLSAEDVWERAKSVLPGLELSTVYRALEALQEANLVVESHLRQGPALFEAQPALHPHLVCEVCGEISHPGPGAGRRLLDALSAEVGNFKVHELHVVARGICAKCVEHEEE